MSAQLYRRFSSLQLYHSYVPYSAVIDVCRLSKEINHALKFLPHKTSSTKNSSHRVRLKKYSTLCRTISSIRNVVIAVKNCSMVHSTELLSPFRSVGTLQVSVGTINIKLNNHDYICFYVVCPLVYPEKGPRSVLDGLSFGVRKRVPKEGYFSR